MRARLEELGRRCGKVSPPTAENVVRLAQKKTESVVRCGKAIGNLTTELTP
jgi:hypothetical protein